MKINILIKVFYIQIFLKFRHVTVKILPINFKLTIIDYKRFYRKNFEIVLEGHTHTSHILIVLFQDMIPTTDGPLEIFVDIFIFEVSKINDIELTMTFELYFDLMWEEKRFVINETSDKWGQVNVVPSLKQG